MTAVALRDASTLRDARELRVDVVDEGIPARSGHTACQIGGDLTFSTEHLESYCLARWEPVVFDALVLTGAIEYCDRLQKRRALHWGRNIEVRVPVHDLDRWRAPAVAESLRDAVSFLTGDRWDITFVARKKAVEMPHQYPFDIPSDLYAVIPFSEGLDSRAVAGLIQREVGDGLIRVRLGSKPFDANDRSDGGKQLFTSVPYRVKPQLGEFKESSARSRGFKFAMVSGLAAYLVKANRIIVPESGQGSLGPVLATVGQAYEDYRNHPLFTDRMERFLSALLGQQVRFEFPRLWFTKGETLAAYASEGEGRTLWRSTWSCWRQNRHASIAGEKRQCGACAACLLRRMSVHAAGLEESPSTYIWEDLGAATVEAGVSSGFRDLTKADREYALAGTLHLDHLASLRQSSANKIALGLAEKQLSHSRGLPETDVRAKLDRLLLQHENEWRGFLASLGPDSFIAKWAETS